MKIKFVALAPIALLAACGQGNDDVVGPDDYVMFSDFFTMDEQVSSEMTIDGGTALVDPKNLDPNANILSVEVLPGDKVGELLTATPQNSPAVEMTP